MKIRAVLFEDDRWARSMLERLLGRRGYEVFAFPHPGLCPLSHSSQCLVACADILVSDVDMPVTSGLEFVERQLRRGCKVKNIALMSGAWSPEEIERARQLGCRTFEKPLDFTELNRWLDECEQRVDPGRSLLAWPIPREPGAGATAWA